jgi:hypothetical protein
LVEWVCENHHRYEGTSVVTKQRLTKRRIALLQIERSVDLLTNHNDPVCALTLAGAAEEILGRIAAARGHVPVVEDGTEYLGSVYDYIGKPRPPKKKLIEAHNRIRNALKHNDDGKNVRVAADFLFEAEEMLLRAIKNYFNAFGCLPSSKPVRGWFEWITL